MYFLDSCICIDFMRGKLPYGYQLFQRSDPRMFKVPALVQAELLLGAEKSNAPVKNRDIVERFLLPFDVVSFDAQSAYEYAVIRAQLERDGQTIGANDLVIAAITLAHKGVLVTSNVQEFKRISGLTIENWCEMELLE